MHIMTKITLGVGVVMLIGSIVSMVAGGGSFMGELVENPTGTEKWTGTSPTTYEGDFETMTLYYVFVEEGKTVDVELVDGIIYKELMLGRVTRDAERALKTVITMKEKQGAQAIVLACTELELVVDTDANVLPVYDSTDIHCRAAADWILG